MVTDPHNSCAKQFKELVKSTLLRKRYKNLIISMHNTYSKKHLSHTPYVPTIIYAKFQINLTTLWRNH